MSTPQTFHSSAKKEEKIEHAKVLQVWRTNLLAGYFCSFLVLCSITFLQTYLSSRRDFNKQAFIDCEYRLFLWILVFKGKFSYEILKMERIKSKLIFWANSTLMLLFCWNALNRPSTSRVNYKLYLNTVPATSCAFSPAHHNDESPLVLGGKYFREARE